MKPRQTWAVVCPKCSAPANEQCWTTSGTQRPTDTHRVRIDAFWRMVEGVA